MDDLTDWIALAQLQCLTLPQKLKLLDRFNSPARVLTLKPADLSTAGSKQRLRTQVNGHELEATINWQASNPAHHLVHLYSPLYPPLLQQIADPPLMLYLTGDPALLARTQLAIVGSRKATRAGEQTAHAFAAELALTGLAITSGMAAGIDAAAHHGAISVQGKTLAILGTGIDVCYPASNRRLYRQIGEQGLLVSEYSLGEEPKKQHFPRRNRIISGLGLGVLVVEAAERSGSLITANCAAQQNREVFAIPGSIHAPSASGCLGLIQQGAKLARNIRDILEEFSEFSAAGLNNTPKGPAICEEVSSPVNSKVLTLLNDSPVSFDKLISLSGLTIDRLCSILLDLELSGSIEKLPGNQYIRTAR